MHSRINSYLNNADMSQNNKTLILFVILFTVVLDIIVSKVFIKEKRYHIDIVLYTGVLEPIRTADRPLRRRMLYPLSYEDSIIMLTCWQVFDKYKNAISLKFLRNCCKNTEIRQKQIKEECFFGSLTLFVSEK